MVPVPEWRLRKQACSHGCKWTAKEKQCFLCGLWQNIITRTVSWKFTVRSVMTYACPTWELATDIYLLKWQRLQNKVLRIIWNFPRRTLVRDLHTAFNLPYVYKYIIKLCRQQAEVIQNHENEHVRSLGKGETRLRKYNRLKLGGCQAYDRSSD
jgi:hypothetical protein